MIIIAPKAKPTKMANIGRSLGLLAMLLLVVVVDGGRTDVCACVRTCVGTDACACVRTGVGADACVCVGTVLGIVVDSGRGNESASPLPNATIFEFIIEDEGDELALELTLALELAFVLTPVVATELAVVESASSVLYPSLGGAGDSTVVDTGRGNELASPLPNGTVVEFIIEDDD